MGASSKDEKAFSTEKGKRQALCADGPACAEAEREGDTES